MKKKLLSILLALSLLIPMLSPLAAIAEEGTAEAAPTVEAENSEVVSEATPAVSEIEPIEPIQSETLTTDNLSFAMTETDAASEGLIGRVKDAEHDLHSVVFENTDGGLTLFYYNDPVKYVDENGVVRDKSNKLQARTGGGFETVAGDIQTAFPKQLKDGITMQKGAWQLGLAPAENFTAIGTLSSDRTTVTYARDAVTRYEYNLTSMGFKEDIVVNRYTGQTRYSFVLKTYGLTPVNDNGTWLLVDSDGIHRATLGEIVVFTADERNNTFGQLQVQQITAGQEYRLTILLDADWLADENTVYPITIDPALSYTNNTANIQDITVCQGTTYSASSGSLYVGRNSSGNIRRALMRFPNLNILGYNITSATVSVRDIMCESWALPMQCYQYTGADWSDSNPMTWANMGDTPVGIYLSGHSVCYVNGKNPDYCATAHRYVYNITKLAQMWADGTASPSDGVVFRATGYYEEGTTNTYKTFASINRSGSYYPQIEIKYLPGHIYPNVTAVEEGATISLSAGIVASEYVEWESTDPSRATVDANGTVTGVSAGKTTINLINTENEKDEIIDTCVVYVTVSDLYDTVVYLKNINNGSYIGAKDKNENTGAYVNFYAQEAHPYQMWNLELDVDQSNHIYTGRFKIQELHSLGLVLEMQESEYTSNAHYVLTADSSIDNERQYWYLKRVNSSSFAIVSDYNEYALTYYNNQLVAKANAGTSSYSWSIQEYQLPESEVPKVIGSAVFTGHDNIGFTYSVSDELLQSTVIQQYGITLSDIIEAVNQWNNISENVVLRYTSDQENSMIKIMLAPDGILESGTLGKTYGSNRSSWISSSSFTNLHTVDYEYIYILLNPLSISNFYESSDEYIDNHDQLDIYFNHQCVLCNVSFVDFFSSVVTHEVGHALKLRHLDEGAFVGMVSSEMRNSDRINFPSIMRTYVDGINGNRVELIIEEQDENMLNLIWSYNITPYDKMILRYKYSVRGGIRL